MIKFENVSKIYYSNSNKEPIVALKDVSFNVEKGEFLSIIGKSGAGKTTLINLLIGEDKPTSGNLFFEGESVPEMNRHQLQQLRRKIGIVHQDLRLLNLKTVKENLEYIMQIIGAKPDEIERDVSQVLEIVGLWERQSNFPHQLSGGEKQRLAIARALIHRPKLLVADEPTGNLDPYNTFEIVDIFRKVHQLGTTIILSTHNKDVVDSLKKRVIALDNGVILADQKEGKLIL
ncbi:ATP-binding cassette domain-containing protein [bacterium]|nr:ATP-binding cassette domain-containing protein [bacterium]